MTAEIVSKPNLPEGKVTMAISALPISGVDCITPPPIKHLPPSMQRHADLQICHLDGAYILAAPEVFDYYHEMLSPLGFIVLSGETRIGSTYPHDAAYNIARVGDVAFHNPHITDPVALRFFEERGIRMIPVRQGYAKCAVIPIGSHSLITADHGIGREAERAGFDVLEIEPGGVELPGFPYGFIGGAAGKLRADTLYITGALHGHPSREKIFDFLQKKSIKIMESSIPIPIDIGSVLPLLCK